MSGRTPSFIVVGLVIIMFLLGFFYMSCSSKNNELRLSLEQFEDQIRSLTLKNRDAEKKIDSLITRKRELEEEKLTIQRQMEKKDSEINDLNTKLNEKVAEIQSLKTEKKVLDDQLKELKTQSETIGSKNSLIEKLQQQINEQKQFGVNEQSRLKEEIEGLKNRLAQPSNNGSSDTLIVPNERFAPRFFNNQTTRSIASLFRNPREDSTNNSREVKPKIVPVGVEFNGNVLNVVPDHNNQSNNRPAANPFVGQNVPPPPLSANDSRMGNPIESAQGAPRLVQAPNQEKLNADDMDREADDDEGEDEEGDAGQGQLPADKAALNRPVRNIEVTKTIPTVEGRQELNVADRQRIQMKEDNYRFGDRERLGHARKSLRRNRLSNGNEDDEETRRGRRRQEARL